MIRYLLIRPLVDEPWLFLSETRFRQIDAKVPIAVWKDAFGDYSETATHRGIKSHFGRHWFTTYWQVHENLNSELVVYLRGDRQGSSVDNAGAISQYIHTYYEDIEDIYRERTFKLDI